MDILPEYQRHEVAASRPGAKGKGVCVLVHPDIAHGVGLWRSMPSAAGLWLVLKPVVTGAASDVYLGGVYIPPAQSALLRTSLAFDRFAALTEAASATSARGKVMIMGDFNARVAARSDIGDDQASSLLALDLCHKRGRSAALEPGYEPGFESDQIQGKQKVTIPEQTEADISEPLDRSPQAKQGSLPKAGAERSALVGSAREECHKHSGK